jgi:hypothetical protein
MKPQDLTEPFPRRGRRMILLLCGVFLLMATGRTCRESDEGRRGTGVIALLDNRKPMDLDRAYLFESMRMGKGPGRNNVALLCTHHALPTMTLEKSSV